MRPRLNLTWLFLSLLLAALIAGGVYGAHWWRTQPDQLYTSAQRYHALAEEARKREDRAGEKTQLEYADKQLQLLLDDKKAAQHTRGWLLRFKVLQRLALLAMGEEEERHETAGNRHSLELIRSAWRCAQTATSDASYGEAQAIMLDKLFKDDQLDQAESFAANLIRHPPATENDGADYTNYFLGARYVLARSAPIVTISGARALMRPTASACPCCQTSSASWYGIIGSSRKRIGEPLSALSNVIDK